MALTLLSGPEYIGKKKTAKHKKHRVAKIAMAPARAAFLEATKLNILHLATKLAKIYKKTPSEIDNFWDKFGGDHAKLKRAIEQGSKQKLGEPITLSAGLATALPIVIKVTDLFKKFGLHTKEDEASTANYTDAAQGVLEKDTTVPKTKATLPEGETTGKIVEDPSVKATDEQGNEIKKPFYKNPKIMIPASIGVLLIAGIAYKAKHE